MVTLSVNSPLFIYTLTCFVSTKFTPFRAAMFISPPRMYNPSVYLEHTPTTLTCIFNLSIQLIYLVYFCYLHLPQFHNKVQQIYLFRVDDGLWEIGTIGKQ